MKDKLIETLKRLQAVDQHIRIISVELFSDGSGYLKACTNGNVVIASQTFDSRIDVESILDSILTPVSPAEVWLKNYRN